ncbi:MAG TPA: hypothetical protein VJT82_08125 [Pyrinomonadaceae bacterium]|nr:hypothetical protein [Pyrinomonadaceae bacterium]
MSRPPVHQTRRAQSSLLLVVLACALALSGEARAQDLVLPPQPAPPPMKYIPEDVRARLSGARDQKARTLLSIAEAEARLARAEQHTDVKRFNAATAELGVYHALLDDAIDFLQQNGKNESKSRDLFKRLEQALHNHAARIESMRRMTPAEFAGNVLALIKHVRDMRTESLEAFYGNTVLRERRDASKDAPPPSPAKPASDKPLKD